MDGPGKQFTILVILAAITISALPSLLGTELQYVHMTGMLNNKCKIHGKEICMDEVSPCVANETYVCCGIVCEGTCDNVQPKCPMKRTCPWRCFCNIGLVRHEDRCIFPSQCPTTP
uniref:TIL domain-containing protein n=1 Tax=Anopheles epiroticus TaxID=199890 RepID=A0A182PRA1_9DIPT